jgi:hypothetical protein
VARAPGWMTPTRRRRLSGALLVGGVLAAGVIAPSPA